MQGGAALTETVDGMGPLGELHIVGNRPECAVATLENYVILLWRRRILLEGALWTRKAFVDLRRRRPNEKIAFFTVLDARCEVSTSSDVRDEIAALLKEYVACIAGASITFEGQGFRMTMVRSIITAINIASRTRFPNSVFSNIHAAAAWTHGHARLPGSTLQSVDVIDAIDRMRAL